MHWILQNNLFNEIGWVELYETLERFKLPHSVHKVIPFIGQITPDINPEGKVICFGSYSLRHLAKERGWTPGVYDLEPSTFEVQKEHWGKLMLNYDSVVTRFADAVVDDLKFVRPIDDTKSFAGRVFEPEEFKKWQYDVCQLKVEDGSTINNNTLIQVSSPKKIYSEYRCWIVDRKIVTISQYKLGDRVVYKNVDNDVGREAYQFAWSVLKGNIFANTSLDGWMPQPAFCLDVCETPDGWRIVEINTINSAGFYAANMTSLVNALEFLNR